jgi:hypothetical protein
LIDALAKLQRYCEKSYAGYDPYDALNSCIPFRKLGYWPPILAVQAMKRLPINLRPLLGVRKGVNPKAMGLFLEAYALLMQREGD